MSINSTALRVQQTFEDPISVVTTPQMSVNAKDWNHVRVPLYNECYYILRAL